MPLSSAPLNFTSSFQQTFLVCLVRLSSAGNHFIFSTVPHIGVEAVPPRRGTRGDKPAAAHAASSLFSISLLCLCHSLSASRAPLLPSPIPPKISDFAPPPFVYLSELIVSCVPIFFFYYFNSFYFSRFFFFNPHVMLSCLIELRGRPCVVDAGLCGDNCGFTKDAILLAKTQTRTHTGYNGTTNRWFSVAEEALFEDDAIRVDELFRHSLTRGTVSSLFFGGRTCTGATHASLRNNTADPHMRAPPPPNQPPPPPTTL